MRAPVLGGGADPRGYVAIVDKGAIAVAVLLPALRAVEECSAYAFTPRVHALRAGLFSPDGRGKQKKEAEENA